MILAGDATNELKIQSFGTFYLNKMFTPKDGPESEGWYLGFFKFLFINFFGYYFLFSKIIKKKYKLLLHLKIIFLLL
jgi:hypothetical protein